MSLCDYQASRALDSQDIPFYGLVMAAMRRADGPNLTVLRCAWPDVWQELQDRYAAPGGVLAGEKE